MLRPRSLTITTSRRRLTRFLRPKLLRLCLAIVLISSLLEVLSVRRALHYNQDLAAQAAASYPRPSQENIFIASIHLHDETLLRSHWNPALYDLVQVLGARNVFVSIFESNSLDDTKGALRELGGKLHAIHVEHKIILDERTRVQEVDEPEPVDQRGYEGWITTNRDGKRRRERRRISYLADCRNKVMRPLQELKEKGWVADKILFLNDVVFDVQDVLTLLTTNAGNYGTACAWDFKDPPKFYDTFAVRDAAGYNAMQLTYPYFRSEASRRAMKYGEPVPMSSCWNGMLAMQASPFYAATSLKFRALPVTLAESHLEASECCLIHADNPLSRPNKAISAETGIYVNPSVRPGYNKQAYDAVNPPEVGKLWLSTFDIIRGLWMNRLRRYLNLGWYFRYDPIGWRVRKWEKEADKAWVSRRGFSGDSGDEKGKGKRRHEPGEFCVVNEMQVLTHDGWRHI